MVSLSPVAAPAERDSLVGALFASLEDTSIMVCLHRMGGGDFSGFLGHEGGQAR